MPEFRVWGHRGDGRGKDENTLASCHQALAKGAYGFELDVQLIDGELWLAHPPKKPTEKLQTVLDAIDVPLILHLKRRRFSPWHDRRAVRMLVPTVEGRDVVLSSFWPGTLTYAKRHFPNLKRAFNSAWLWYDLLFSDRLGTYEYVGLRPQPLGAKTVQRAKRRGERLVVFTTDNTDVIRKKFERFGVTDVMTDDVDFWTTRNVTR